MREEEERERQRWKEKQPNGRDRRRGEKWQRERDLLEIHFTYCITHS